MNSCSFSAINDMLIHAVFGSHQAHIVSYRQIATTGREREFSLFHNCSGPSNWIFTTVWHNDVNRLYGPCTHLTIASPPRISLAQASVFCDNETLATPWRLRPTTSNYTELAKHCSAMQTPSRQSTAQPEPEPASLMDTCMICRWRNVMLPGETYDDRRLGG